MAEPLRDKKVSLRNILDEMAEDEAFTEEERQRAQEAVLELEYQEWSSRQKKSSL